MWYASNILNFTVHRNQFNRPKMTDFGAIRKLTDALELIESTFVKRYPQRPSEQPCPHYVRTGKCSYGSSCRFHHPSSNNTEGRLPKEGDKLYANIANDDLLSTFVATMVASVSIFDRCADNEINHKVTV